VTLDCLAKNYASCVVIDHWSTRYLKKQSSSWATQLQHSHSEEELTPTHQVVSRHTFDSYYFLCYFFGCYFFVTFSVATFFCYCWL